MSDAYSNGFPNEGVDQYNQLTTIDLRFPGQIYDAESGLYYNYYRYYDSQLGRYVTSDPIGLNGGINTFAYVGGNPVGYIDPLGLAETSINGFYKGYGSIETMKLINHGDIDSLMLKNDGGILYKPILEDIVMIINNENVSLASLLKDKMANNSKLYFIACNTATSTRNSSDGLAAEMSKKLKNTEVIGFKGFINAYYLPIPFLYYLKGTREFYKNGIKTASESGNGSFLLSTHIHFPGAK